MTDMTLTALDADLAKRIEKYCNENPNVIYAGGYDETITDEQANMLVSGQFDEFSEAMFEVIGNMETYGGFWDYWNDEFLREFGDELGAESFDDLDDEVQECIRDNRLTDDSDYIETVIKQWRGNIVATILKPGAQEPENLIYAPETDDEVEDQKLARYLIDAFGVELRATEGNKTARLMQDIEVVYGGYDREQLVLCGRLDLLAIYKSRQAPQKVTIGPEDADHLLFYDFHNGCGNMGYMKITKTRTMPATFMVDGTRGYGVDSCYGFTGEWWRHEIKIA